MAIGVLKAGINSQDATASNGDDLVDTVNYVYGKAIKIVMLSDYADADAVNSATAYDNALTYADSIGAALVVNGDFDFAGESATHDKYVSVSGFGTIRNLTINVNLAPDDSKKVAFKDFSFISDDGTDTINLIRSKSLEIGSVNFVNVDYPISSTATTFHYVSLTNVHNCRFFGCDSPIYFDTANAGNRPFSDLIFVNNVIWFSKVYGIYANQLDGLTYSDNLSHFDDNVSTSKNHLCVEKGEQIVIGSGNNFFNCGEEAIKMTNTTSCQIGGSQRFWHNGQNVTSSAVKFANDGSHFLNLTIDGALHFEKPSLHMIEVQATQGLVKIGEMSGVIDVRIAYNASTNPTGHYYGPDDLNGITHYGIYAPLGCAVASSQENLKFINSGGTLLNIGNSYPTTETLKYSGVRNVAGVTKTTKTITTNAATTLFRVFDSLQTNGDASGEILINAYGSTGKRATYKLLVCVDTTTASIALVSSVGKTAGAAADEPSFTFAIAWNGDVSATRVASTPSGVFDFVIYGQGDLYPRNLS